MAKQFFINLIPGEVSGLAGAAAVRRAAEPVGIIEIQDARLTRGADLAPIDRVVRVPVDLDRPPLTRFD
jgi:hypothetical protein